MLNEKQVKRLLKQCEDVNDTYKDMCGDEGPKYFDYTRNKGWIQALRLVLEEDTYPIRRDPIDGK
jgi:hypothetical protein